MPRVSVYRETPARRTHAKPDPARAAVLSTGRRVLTATDPLTD
jgi:hypothetical protein